MAVDSKWGTRVKYSRTGNSLDLRGRVDAASGVDYETALAAAITQYDTPLVVGGDSLILDTIDLTEINVSGESHWDARAAYIARQSPAAKDQNATIGGTEFSFSIAGRQERIYEAILQNKYARPGETAPDHGNRLNVQKGKVQGLDIQVPQIAYTRTEIFDAAQITAIWLENAAEAIATTNIFPAGPGGWIEQDRGLLTGIEGRAQGDNTVRVDFTWAVGHKLKTDFDVAGITVPLKSAHQYLWVDYEEQEDAAAAAVVTRARGVYVATVYNSFDHTILYRSF